jgi:hypothetical protein
MRGERAPLKASPREQIDQKHNQSNHKQDMNQSAGDMQAEAQKPKYKNDYKNCPKHSVLLGDSEFRA